MEVMTFQQENYTGTRTSMCMQNLPSVGKVSDEECNVHDRVLCMSNLPSLNKILMDGSTHGSLDVSYANGRCSYLETVEEKRNHNAVNQAPSAIGDPVKALGSLPGIVQIRNRLGVGSFSHVYQCRTERQIEDVAVKILLRSNGSEENREARILMELSHPNLIRLVDYIQVDNINALVLELCTGGSLMAFLHGSSGAARALASRFNLYRRLTAVNGIVCAAAYLHALNIVHRDIKSGNCFLSHQVDARATDLPLVKLGDLGLARSITAAAMTRGTGTVRYMAPEVIMSNHYGLAADVFSLGIMIHEVASGEVPYSDLMRNDASLVASIAQGLRPSASALPQSAIRVDLPSILETCWATDENARLTSSELHAFVNNAIKWIPEQEATYTGHSIV